MAHLPLSRTAPAPLAPCAPQPRLTLLGRVLGVWRQRQHLEQLDEHMRRDIGLSDSQIARETQRPLWDVPQTWRL